MKTGTVVTAMGWRALEYECGVNGEKLKKHTGIYQDDGLVAPIASSPICPMHVLWGEASTA